MNAALPGRDPAPSPVYVIPGTAAATAAGLWLGARGPFAGPLLSALAAPGIAATTAARTGPPSRPLAPPSPRLRSLAIGLACVEFIPSVHSWRHPSVPPPAALWPLPGLATISYRLLVLLVLRLTGPAPMPPCAAGRAPAP
ncbi:hypothetical protein [Mycetocola spongiae]|uniref:hypothetical protein n=1 Tax=Mycetocola spongiae TaxID=2859226 RepID=UPI001CF5D0A3|nr:hypothetical protein [Mycetocola spongiae]UCR88726.1 hypothetical protein KXZ72_12310 [Mycetocola spongiae]